MAQAPFAQGTNRQVGDHWLGRRLGSGGQGVVYEVYDRDGTRVAIKLLRLYRMERAQARARVAEEVAATRRVAAFCTTRVITPLQARAGVAALTAVTLATLGVLPVRANDVTMNNGWEVNTLDAVNRMSTTSTRSPMPPNGLRAG